MQKRKNNNKTPDRYSNAFSLRIEGAHKIVNVPDAGSFRGKETQSLYL